MADPASTAPGERGHRRGGLTGWIAFPFQLFGMLCGSLLLSIVIECVGMHFFWERERWHHAERMFDYEINQLSTHFTQSLLVEEPGRTAHRLVEWTCEHVFVSTGLLEWARANATRSHSYASHARGIKRILGLAYVNVEEYVLAACYTVLTFLVRLVVLTLTLPLFAMAAFVGLVDGLVRRDIRRFGAGRESGFIYHRAKAALLPIVVFPWLLYLAFPVSVHPLAILLPGAIVLSIAVNITAGAFKKYL
jgi:integrating conjugative element membrane protein (TIGR03747 family)